MITSKDFSTGNLKLYKEAKKDNVDSLFSLLENLLESDFDRDELIKFVNKEFKSVSEFCVDYIKRYN